jgi:DNA-binding IclR family transcriptional regulator
MVHTDAGPTSRPAGEALTGTGPNAAPIAEGVSGAGYTVAAVARALDVLCAFERPPHEFGPSRLARQLGMTKNHVFRVLKTLEAHGFVRRVDDRYRVGMRALEIGQLALKHMDLVRVARPFVQSLHGRTGETVHLAVLDGEEAVCVDRMESLHPVRLSAEIGKRFPLHAGACPKVLLAYLPEAHQRRILERQLPAFTEYTITDRIALARELDEIRSEGYGVGDQDLDLGAAAVAAPIRDHTGQVVSAISVAGPLSRVGGCLRTELRREVVAAADDISLGLGFSRKGPVNR